MPDGWQWDSSGFERDMRALMRRTAPDGRFAEQVPPTEIMTWRKPLGMTGSVG
jgi:hypothetical protein